MLNFCASVMTIIGFFILYYSSILTTETVMQQIVQQIDILIAVVLICSGFIMITIRSIKPKTPKETEEEIAKKEAERKEIEEWKKANFPNKED